MFVLKSSKRLVPIFRGHFTRLYSNKLYQEVSIPVPWGEIRGKWWGPTNVRPILTIHGWQDNCGSFDRLIPLLDKNLGFLAIDLPGHGYSSYLPPGIFYQFISYQLTIKYIRQHFQWTKSSLMGHSLGGALSFSYAMMYPQSVDFVICIDGLKPLIPKDRLSTLGSGLRQFMKMNEFALASHEPPSYSLNEIKKMVHQQGSILLEYTPYVIERNVMRSKEYPEKYYFSRDPRIRVFDLFPVCQEDVVQRAHHVTCPIFITKSIDSSYFEPKENFFEVLDVLKRTSKDCDFHFMKGTHHAHLNNPEDIAKLLNLFLKKHDVENRQTYGDTKEDMVVSEKS